MPLTGNKGEWSEVYVLFRLLADGKLYAADNNMQRNENIYFPILKIIRKEGTQKDCEYRLENSAPSEVLFYLNNKLQVQHLYCLLILYYRSLHMQKMYMLFLYQML